MDNNAVEYVILDCIGSSGKGVTLNPTKSTPFHIVLPAISFAQFRVVLYSSDGKKMTINSDKPLTIKRSKRTTASTIEYLADKPEYEFVDLGLSVNWATCNVGAEKPEDYGDYYAWGETEPKTDYSWENYKFRTGGDSYDNVKFSKYNTSSICGTVDNQIILFATDDAAHVQWGGSWRMPTKAELDELRNNCTWTWYSSGNTEFNGVAGYKVTSNVSGYTDRFIFLPAAGYRNKAIIVNIGPSGHYWTSSLVSNNPIDAYSIYFTTNYASSMSSGDFRYIGRSVRPVFPSDTWVPETSLSLDRTSLSLETEESVKLSATARKDGDVVSYSVTWSSDNTAIATVDQDGNVKAISSGTAIITATCEGVKATCTVTVTAKKTPAPEYVDLGLSVLWASCNLGASSPEEYGDYYAWGETVTRNQTDMTNLNNYNYSGSYIRSYYTWATYKWGDGTPSGSDVIKYSSTDGKETLDLGDDVANTIKGGKWRMPTYSEMAELLDNCTWTWTTYNDIYGYEVKSNINNNKIFLPAAGAYYHSFLDAPSTTGNYWSSTVDVSSRLYAKIIHFRSNSSNTSDHSLRDIGASIRPVYDENMEIHEYVDLGLSVKWATCNVGASKPEEYGDYYAWGETETKSTYDLSTYKWCKGSYKSMIKYCDDSNYGHNSFTDYKTTLDPEDDVARQKWGGNWRMPTITEFEELINNCTWTWTTMNGVNGYKVTSKKSGYTDRFIFLPAAGYRRGTSLSYAGECGYYWYSSLLAGYPYNARYLFFGSGTHDTYGSSRDYGLSVRPVCP